MKQLCRKRIKAVLPLVLLFIFFIIPLVVHAAVSGPELSGGIAAPEVDQNGNVTYARQGKEKEEMKEKFKEDELLVKYKPGVSDKNKDSLHKKHGSTKIKEFPSLRLHHIKLKKGLSVEEAIEKYKADTDVEYAEPNYAVSTQTTPNDPSFSSQWALHNTTYPGVDIDAPDAWSMTTGTNTVVIAVIDTGVDYNHPDLAANIWVNNTELNGAAGYDDDANGYVDDIHGIDTYNNDSDPMDDNNHGTHVAGIISAVGDNGVGIAGINWNVQIMPCKFIGAGGSGNISGAIACLQYIKTKKDAGVNIVATNNSWGSDSYSQALRDAIDAQREILFIAAAGNNGTTNNKYAFYPANYDLPNVISVAAFNSSDALSSFSNFGSRTAHVGAPGENIYSTIINNNYASFSGTSMAAPHVTGLAALLKAQDPTRDWKAIKNLILSGGVDTPAMNGKTITGKRINANGSLTCSNKSVFAVLGLPSSIVSGASYTLSALSINCGLSAGPVTVTLGGGGTISLHDDGVAPDLAAGDGIFSGTWIPAGIAVETLVFNFPTGSRTVASPPVLISDQSTPNPPASIVATGVTSAATGTVFSQTFTASGGIRPLIWSVSSGSLPDGLTLNSATGEISGIPIAGGVYTFTVQVTDAIGMTDAKSWTIFLSKGLRAGWPQVLQQRAGTGLLPASYSPIFADLNGDGKEEIIVADVSTLYVFDANGLVTKTVLPGKVSTPVVADINNDGKKEIIVGVGYYYSSTNSIYAFHGDLTPLPGFPAGTYTTLNGGPGDVKSLVAADFDNDGKMEIIALCLPNNLNDPNWGKNVIVMVDSQGNMVPGWPKIVSGAEFSTADYPPAVGDIDNDGQKEIVFVTNDGFVHIYHKDGIEIRSWQYEQNPGELSPPILADVDGDGFPEIVIRSSGTRVHVLNRFGAELAGWPRDFIYSPPNGLVAADLDGDGRIELIFQTGQNQYYRNQLQALHADGSSLPGWPVTIDGGYEPDAECNPVVADINGDGQLEVLVNVDWGLLTGKGELLAYTSSGTLVPGYPKYTTPNSAIISTLAVGDLDNNGRVDIAVKSEDGMLYVWEEDQISTGRMNEWPMFRHDPQHTGKLTITPDTTPDQFIFTDQTNAPANTLIISNSITVTGINMAIAVTISGGEYELNNSGIWSSATGTVIKGNTVRVRQTSAPTYGMSTDTVLTIGGISDTFSVTTQVYDATPDPFSFIDQMNAALNTLIISNSITVTGINMSVAVTISGGEYELNNSGIWLSTSGTVVNGNTIRVRRMSASTYGTRTDTILTIGGVSDTFSILTTLTADIDATLTTNLASPQPASTFVTVTSNGIGGSGNGNYEYKFRLNVSGTWTTMQDYSTSNTWIWDTTGHGSGDYIVGVYVRNRGDSIAYAVEKTVGYSLYNIGNIYTVAGGVGDGGQAVSAKLVSPFNIATDAFGNIYIADHDGYRVRKVDAATSVMSTVAGNGTFGYSGDGGLAAKAALRSPSGVALDATGNIYFADQSSNRIRKVIAATGVITTVAGNGAAGYSGDNGPATSAFLNAPSGVALDGSGNIYIADQSNHRIRKVTVTSGVITTVAGNGTSGYSGDNGPATTASLQSPRGVAVDGFGNIYIADTSNSRIRRVDAITGVITTVAGNGMSGYFGDNGAATSAALNLPYGIALNNRGDVYIADTSNNRIRKVDATTGVISTLAGTGTSDYAGDNGPAVSAKLASPSGVFADAAGNILIADNGNHRIRKVETATGIITTVAGISGDYAGDNGLAQSALLSYPGSVAYDSSGNIFIADTWNYRIRRVDAVTRVITTVAGNGTWGYSGDNSAATLAGLSPPAGVALDTMGNIYIADLYHYSIRRVDAVTGVITTVAGNGAAGYSGDNGVATNASLNNPSGLALDGRDNIYIVDQYNQRIRKVDSVTGVITTVAGNGSAGYSGDNGAATSASLNFPSEVALNGRGDIFIADTNNNRIRKVDAITGVITTVAGNGSAGYSGDNGPAASAGLYNPKGVAADEMGNAIYIADTYNSRIRQVDTVTGVIKTVAGNGVSGFSGDNGPATAISISPSGVAVDSMGNVYIADQDNMRIRKIAALDTTPDAISFSDQTDVSVNTQVMSNAITVTGINIPVAISITGGEYEINGNGVWTSATGTINNGCSVRVLQTSSANFSTRTSTILTIGGVSGTFSVMTIAADTLPDVFAFTSQTNAALSTLVTSNTITASGINSVVPVTISGGAYEINNSGVWSSTSGTVTNGNTIRVRLMSSANYNTLTSATLTIGGVSATFNVTTVFSPATNIMIPGTTPAYFLTLQSALNMAANNDTIMVQANEFTENLVLSRPVSIIISGGYDSSFSSTSGSTTIKGSLTIGDGTITIGSGAISIY